MPVVQDVDQLTHAATKSELTKIRTMNDLVGILYDRHIPCRQKLDSETDAEINVPLDVQPLLEIVHKACSSTGLECTIKNGCVYMQPVQQMGSDPTLLKIEHLELSNVTVAEAISAIGSSVHLPILVYPLGERARSARFNIMLSGMTITNAVEAISDAARIRSYTITLPSNQSRGPSSKPNTITGIAFYN